MQGYRLVQESTLQAGLTINPLGLRAPARANANGPRDARSTHATRAGHRMSLSRSHGRLTYPSGTLAHAAEAIRLANKKFRKNRYMRCVQGHRGPHLRGLPLPLARPPASLPSRARVPRAAVGIVFGEGVVLDKIGADEDALLGQAMRMRMETTAAPGGTRKSSALR